MTDFTLTLTGAEETKAGELATAAGAPDTQTFLQAEADARLAEQLDITHRDWFNATLTDAQRKTIYDANQP